MWKYYLVLKNFIVHCAQFCISATRKIWFETFHPTSLLKDGRICSARTTNVSFYVIFWKFVLVDIFKLQSCRNQEEFQLLVARNIAIVQQYYTTQSVSTW